MRRRTSLSGDFSSRKRRTILRSSSCSSLKPKFITDPIFSGTLRAKDENSQYVRVSVSCHSGDMDNVELVWQDASAEVHRFVVGPVENNVYVVRCKRTGL